MEALPRLPMISFELKVSPDKPSTDFSKLKQYIRDFYHEDPEAYNTEIRALATLRASAVHPVKDATGCSVLKRYFSQLHFLQSRFPMAREGTAAVEFTWKDTYGNAITTVPDIKAELVAILYNIGALHTQLGAAGDRASPEELKMACTHFQCGAWAFQHLKDTYPQPPCSDVSSDVMQFKYQLSLAQAQECILEKSMSDNRKASINAKVSTQVVDYYNLALSTLLQTPSDALFDGVIIGDIVGTKNFKSWKKYIKFKAAFYSCITLLYLGMDAEEKQKMGERVAYYQGALDKLNDAIKLSKGLDKSNEAMECLVFTRDVVEGKRKAAKNENEFIYHEEVPDLDSLSYVKGASLVKGIPFSVYDPEISGPDLFSKLVPMKAHEAASLYSEEKAKLLRKTSSLIDAKDEELVSFMSCLQLEYIKAHMDTNILPQEIIDRCAALSSMPDAIPNLMTSMDKLNSAYHEVDGMLKEITELIKEEEISEKEYQEIMGPRPPSIVATDLTREANKYTEAHKKAAESNETLHQAMTQHIENLKVLQLPLNEIQASLPNLDALNLHEDETLNEVIMLVNKVNEMKKQRAMLVSQLRESICSDDITGLLVLRNSEEEKKNLEDIFLTEIRKHQKYVTLIEQNLSAQDNILRALTEAYAAYAPTRKATTEIMRQRDAMLSALVSSYDAYEDLIAKSGKGLEFYRKLETNLTKLLQRVRGTCKVQEEERETILAQNAVKKEKLPEVTSQPSETNAVGGSSGVGGGGSSVGMKLKDYLQARTTQNQQPAPAKDWSTGTTGTSASGTVPTGGNNADYSLTSQAAANYSKGYDPYAMAYNAQYYYNALYSQNPALSNVQYPSMPDSSSQYAVSYAAYNQAQPSNAYSQYGSTVGAQPQYSYPTPSTASVPSSSTLQAYTATPAVTAASQYSSSSTPLSYQYSQAGGQTAVAASSNSATGGIVGGGSSYNPTGGVQTAGASNAYVQTNSVQPASIPTSYTQNNGPQATVNSSSYGKVTGAQPAGGSSSYSQITAVQPAGASSSYGQVTGGQPAGASGSFGQVTGGQPAGASGSYGPVTGGHPVGATISYGQVTGAQPAAALPSYSQTGGAQTAGVSYGQTGATPGVPSSYNQSGTQAAGVANSYNNYASGYSQYYAPAQQISQSPASTTYQQSSTATSSQNWQQYYNNSYGQNPSTTSQQSYYNSYRFTNSYPQAQFQSTPGTESSSYYARAGSKESATNSTVSPQPSQDVTYEQYATPNASTGAYPANYYVQPYGSQYASNGIPQAPAVSQPAFDQSSLQPSTMTYMQASHSSQNLTMTFSQQEQGRESVTTVKPSSNVDLLAGLDFNVKDAPLLPTEKSNSLVPEKTVEDKLSNLSIASSSSATNGPASQDTLVKPKVNLDAEQPANAVAIERPSPSKTPSKDPFSDTDVLNQFVQEVEKFDKFVESLNSKTLNGPTNLDLKWNELQDLQEKDAHKLIISVARCYPMKNRFPDILPYDSSRVELPSTKDDYINASYVKDLGQGCPNFIMTQAPLPSTYADFWTMVLEHHVELIVCLMSEAQLNDEIYWAVDKTNDLVFGKLKVSLQSCNVRSHWVERILSVSDGKNSRVVIHLEFTGWPHSWLPESPGPLLNLINETFSVWSQQRGKGPVVVHCDAGVGRSGVFVIIALSIAELKTSCHLPEVTVLAAKLAKNRKNPLRDRQHMQFAYQCLLYYSQDLLMKRGILSTRSSFEEKRNKTKTHTRHPSEDFLLNSLREHQERRQSDASSTTSSSSKPAEGDPLSQIDPLWPIKRYS